MNSHAAPEIRRQIMDATSSKLAAKTQRERARYDGRVFGLMSALQIVLRSPEGENSPTGYTKYHRHDENAVLTEITRYMGGEDQMREIGFMA